MRRKMTFADLSAHVQEVFASMCKDGVTPEENYEGFKKLTYDLNHNPNEMFDEDGNKKTKRDAEDAVRKFVYAIMGLNENSTKRDRIPGDLRGKGFLSLHSYRRILIL